MNNIVGNFFITGKGLRQGDPLSPLLFDQVVDVLTRMLVKASNAGLIKGLSPDICPGGVICLQYADDTILFSDSNVTYTANLKKVLTCFEQVSGMRINYSKSELIPLGLEPEELEALANILECTIGEFPIKYLGIPLHYDKLRRADLQPLIDKILRRIAGWRGKLLSYASRVLMIRTCLASIPVYLLSFFKFPKWALDLINSQMANCLWNDFEGHRKLHLANWELICRRKQFGGLGIPDLANVNLCLLASWIKRYSQDNSKLWKTMVDHKYNTKNPNIFCSDEVGVSRFWKEVMWAVNSTKFGYRWNIGDGNTVRFWEDTLCGTSPLAVQYFDLYALCNEQGMTVRQIWDGS
jgi:hypothetical protein